MRSDAQREASRTNGAKSRGPVTDEGKNASKFNRLQHGLRAEHVVLPGEDPGEFEAEKQAWFDDWKPVNHTRAILVERAAVASWRLRRAVKAERDVLAAHADEAGRRFDDNLRDHVEQLAGQIDSDPVAIVTRLKLCRDGIDRLIRGWRGLADALGHGTAGRNQIVFHHRLMLMLGHARDVIDFTVGDDAVASTRLLAVNDPARKVRPLGKDEGRQLVSRLRRLVATRLRELRLDRRAVPDPADQRARAVGSAAAMAHASKEAQTRHRYEMTIDRSLRATVHQLVTLTKSKADLGGPAEAGPGDATDPPEVTRVPASEPVEAGPSDPPSRADTAAAPGSFGAGDFAGTVTAAEGSIASPNRPSRAAKRAGRRRSRR